MIVINEKEIALNYYQGGLFSSYCIGFFDLDKDIKIQTYKVSKSEQKSCLINKVPFIYFNIVQNLKFIIQFNFNS